MEEILGTYGASATDSELDTITRMVPWIRAGLERDRCLPPAPHVPLSEYAGTMLQRAGNDLRRGAEHADMGTLAALWFPNTDGRLREAAEMFQVWTTFADEGIAEAGRPYGHYVELCDAALRGDILADPADPVLLCLRLVRRKIEALDADRIIPELSDALLESNRSWCTEQEWRAPGGYPSLQEYLRERGNVVFTYVLAVLLRIHYRLLGNIPPAVVHHARTVALVTGLENDLLSAYREAQVGTPLTLLRTVQKEYGLPLKAAVQCSVAVTNSIRLSSEQLAMRLLADPALSEPERQYVRAMNGWADSCYAWQLGAKRYRLAEVAP